MKAIGAWRGMLGKQWYSWDEFVEKVKEWKVSSAIQYLARYKLDPRMPSVPRLIYPNEWKDVGGSFKAVLDL